MSILIRNMEMPMNCAECPIADIGAEFYYCEKIELKVETRPCDCPLVEVSEPSYTDAWCHDCSEYDNEHHCCHRWSHVIRKTVDELQLVHCKDCIYYDSDNKMCLDMIGFGRRWEETDYCSYGRRAE